MGNRNLGQCIWRPFKYACAAIQKGQKHSTMRKSVFGISDQVKAVCSADETSKGLEI